MSGFRTEDRITSWGRIERTRHRVARPVFESDVEPLLQESQPDGSVLAVGLRRSYGDSCLNADNALLDMVGLDRFIGFDDKTGLLRAQAGATLGQILEFAKPRGYFLPVTPGTKFVTLAGAIANDVHGKNHGRNGTVGRWVREIGLMRSDGTHHRISPDDQTGMFAATIGGLGLTGVITDVTLQLIPVAGPSFETETVPFGHVSEFFELAAESAHSHDYTVAWIDCFASGKNLGRGIFSRANHIAAIEPAVSAKRMIGVPFDMPQTLLNRLSMSTFNSLYYHLGRGARRRRIATSDQFLYPLDRLSDWNRLYGRRGLYQYQSVVPKDVAADATAEMLQEISNSGQGSFLIVLKNFGALPSPGMLSFPFEGTTLALDFPNRGDATLGLLARLDRIVKAANGRLYPAKDGRFSPEMFAAGYPRLDEFSKHVDSAFSSSFWRRMKGTA